MRDDLYEQCSDHITEYMASSRWLGVAAEDAAIVVGLVVGEARAPGGRRDRRDSRGSPCPHARRRRDRAAIDHRRLGPDEPVDELRAMRIGATIANVAGRVVS